MHVILHLYTEERAPILVRNHDCVAIVLLQSHLNRYPLVIREEEGLRHRFVVVLTSVEEESSCVSSNQIHHETPFELDYIAVFLRILWLFSDARSLI